MEIIKDIHEMTEAACRIRSMGLKSSLVPTMGYLHEGHLCLVRLAKKISDRVIVSIFVNPAQFGPNEDLAKYPRDIERDISLLEAERVDALFYPEAKAMYPAGFQTFINVEALSGTMCGASRPGHFRGVATVVAKLFNIVQPDTAVFGEKDFQQLAIIRRMVEDLNMPIKVIGHPIVREKDGLAMSSRNVYLNSNERKTATVLFESLELARTLIKQDEHGADRIRDAVKRHILSRPGTKIDYIFIGDTETLKPVKTIKDRGIIALAVLVGSTRLIDNIILGPV
ncbi:MAG: pantoate--beta-alanine ligase [Desulfobacteraceae bacterium]|nr:pantoate--beta-alanine ligase [Desulfobacteraceae bacterium]